MQKSLNTPNIVFTSHSLHIILPGITLSSNNHIVFETSIEVKTNLLGVQENFIFKPKVPNELLSIRFRKIALLIFKKSHLWNGFYSQKQELRLNKEVTSHQSSRLHLPQQNYRVYITKLTLLKTNIPNLWYKVIKFYIPIKPYFELFIVTVFVEQKVSCH